jgi:hypothetical protein
MGTGMIDTVSTYPVVMREGVSWQKVGKIKILLLYIVYPFAIATYFKKALEHRDDVDLLVCGPYTGNWIPWLGGMNVEPKYAIPPDLPLPFGPDVGEINYELVKHMLPEGWIPDIVLNIDAHLHWKNKPTDGMVVTVGTDPHVLNDWYDAPRKYSDKFFNMQLCYSKESDIYLPYAYSKYDHYPASFPTKNESGQEVNTFEKDTDAVLIGMPYDNRVQWVNELRKRGVSVIFGNGPIFDEARTLYNRGRIGLNWSSMNDLNARAFEIPAMKLCPVMNVVPDAEKFMVEGFSYLPFDNINLAIEHVMWAKDNPEDAQVIAARAYNSIQGQTYDARIQQILDECGYG